jgi:hypothetical protein
VLEVLWEARIQDLGAAVVHGDGSGIFKLLLAEGPAGEYSDRPDADLVGRLDVPDGIADGDGLLRRGTGPLEG